MGQQRVVEGVLGLGTTELGKTLARALALDFRRIQFTPDLMPADIVGTNVMSSGRDGRYFEFSRGPIFTLRATPNASGWQPAYFPSGTSWYFSAHSRMKRTRSGRMR